ncbi:identical protein binding [Homalodisca vitripennis]|uniref:Schwannomin interacting protein 1 C-terminal domain-containing protein n=1 Tax=Homalodisca liturata TaxID=320908 RepID=A0A1B6J602_9HEMI|nr:identical protein binding [Homalodisca vitripennis]
MFENILSNFKTKSTKVSESLSVESFKEKTSRISESFSNIRCNLMNKTNSLSSYFLTTQNTDGPNKTAHKINDTDLFSPTSQNSRLEYILFNPIADCDDAEDDIVDRFVRVINIDEDRQSLNRQYSFRRRNDREEIRRRLATGCDGDEYYGGDRPGRKPSLQARLQSGMNLQICFMNDTMSDTESPSSDSEAPAKAVSPMKQPSPLSVVPDTKPALTANGTVKSPRGGLSLPLNEPQTEADFFACQARLQAEARLALAQAKDMARLQMEVERQRRQVSPITEMLRTTLHKVGVVFPQDRRRVSRQMLTDMNVAQLQVIVNDLHTQIEYLNESLVKFLMERDDLHMSQDSMLVDIEDLTRYLGAKENTLKEDISFNNNLPTTKPKANRIAAPVRK